MKIEYKNTKIKSTADIKRTIQIKINNTTSIDKI